MRKSFSTNSAAMPKLKRVSSEKKQKYWRQLKRDQRQLNREHSDQAMEFDATPESSAEQASTPKPSSVLYHCLSLLYHACVSQRWMLLMFITRFFMLRLHLWFTKWIKVLSSTLDFRVFLWSIFCNFIFETVIHAKLSMAFHWAWRLGFLTQHCVHWSSLS